MPDGMSYLGLRCVLEYLEANKRIHITARSPVLQKFEKSVPLHIDSLEFINSATHLNEIKYDSTLWWPVHLVTRGGKKPSFLLIPKGIQASDVREIRLSRFLDGKEDVYVNRLHFHFVSGLNLLPNLQLKIRKLDTDRFSFRDGYLNVVHPWSYPLMELRTVLKNIEDLDHDVFQSAKKLVIPSMLNVQEVWFIPNLTKLTNLEIEIKYMYRDDETKFIRMIQNYLSVPRSMGACLKFGGLSRRTFDRLLTAVRNQLSVTNVNVKEPGLEPHAPLSILIKSTSTALVYGILSPFKTVSKVKIEVVP